MSVSILVTLDGSGRRIRTLTYGVRVRCATITQSRYIALFAALCRELAVLLRDNDDVWFREGVLSDVVPYDTNN